MKRSILALGVVVFVWGPTPALAFESYAARLPNRASATNDFGVEKPCITCHNNADGGAGCLATGGAKPCLNPFGIAFKANGVRWNAALASGDADLDGFTNGQELQDPLGAWSAGPSPGIAAHVTRPGFANENPGMTDADGDGFCWFGEDLNSNGNCTDPNENNGGLDCNDAVMSVNSGQAEMCDNEEDNDCNGLVTLEDPTCLSIVDRDGDGFCPMGTDMNNDRDCLDAGEDASGEDCNDDASNVYLGAQENCIDGLDNNCDGKADGLDPACNGERDADGDGYCAIGTDRNNDGDCLDPGEENDGFDCDDSNENVNQDQIEGDATCSDGLDNDCDGFPDFRDMGCASLADGDSDGYCPTGQDLNGDGDCADAGEANGAIDCNDSDPLFNPGIAEVCTDGEDNDCDDSVDLMDTDCAGYLDSDGDRYCFVGSDINRDGDCADPMEDQGNADCDDTLPDVNPISDEICFDTLDNNCDGSVDARDPECVAYLDLDFDGWCEIGQDLNQDGDCTDDSEQVGEDFAPNDPTVSPSASENCFDGKDNDQNGEIDLADSKCTGATDADGDGYCAVGIDLNGDGDCEDVGEGIGDGMRGVSDCNDGDPLVFPMGKELCADNIDNDCDGDVDNYPMFSDGDCDFLLDIDGDGYCGMGIDDNRDGDCLDNDEDRFGEDCAPLDRNISPRAVEVCDDEVDNDCDGNVDSQDSECPCVEGGCDDVDACTIDSCGDDGRCVFDPDPLCTTSDAGMADGALDGGGMVDDEGCGCVASSGSGTATGAWFLLAFAWIRKRGRLV